jgi:twitching motility protein PilU
MEKSMAPGSQTFEQSLFKLFIEGHITQDEAMANADSATNMLWLINQATAGQITSGQVSIPVPPVSKPEGDKKEGLLGGGGDATFTNIKIDMTG